MKKLLSLILFLMSTLSMAQTTAVYDSIGALDIEFQELVLDFTTPVEDLDFALVINNKSYPLFPESIEGSKVTFRLLYNHDYHIIINDTYHVDLTTESWDVIDDRDLTITSDVGYNFQDGVLVFHYYKF